MKMRKSVWCCLDGKKHCDVVQWALAANVSVDEAKKLLSARVSVRYCRVYLTNNSKSPSALSAYGFY